MLSGGRVGDYVHNSTMERIFFRDVREMLVGPQLALFQNHMPRGLKGLFRETLSAVNILSNWELPPYNFCALLIWFGTYWVFAGVGIQDLER